MSDEIKTKINNLMNQPDIRSIALRNFAISKLTEKIADQFEALTATSQIDDQLKRHMTWDWKPWTEIQSQLWSGNNSARIAARRRLEDSDYIESQRNDYGKIFVRLADGCGLKRDATSDEVENHILGMFDSSAESDGVLLNSVIRALSPFPRQQVIDAVDALLSSERIVPCADERQGFVLLDGDLP